MILENLLNYGWVLSATGVLESGGLPSFLCYHMGNMGHKKQNYFPEFESVAG